MLTAGFIYRAVVIPVDAGAIFAYAMYSHNFFFSLF
jgi:hypothetical protein